MLRTIGPLLIALLTSANSMAAAAPAGGPKEPVVAFVAGLAADDLLKIRTEASAIGPVVARLPNGTAVRNFGCAKMKTYLWCKVQAVGDPRINGWAPQRYLLSSEPVGSLDASDLARGGTAEASPANQPNPVAPKAVEAADASGSAATPRDAQPVVPPDLLARLGGTDLPPDAGQQSAAAAQSEVADASYSVAFSTRANPTTGEVYGSKPDNAPPPPPDMTTPAPPANAEPAQGQPADTTPADPAPAPKAAAARPAPGIPVPTPRPDREAEANARTAPAAADADAAPGPAYAPEALPDPSPKTAALPAPRPNPAPAADPASKPDPAPATAAIDPPAQIAQAAAQSSAAPDAAGGVPCARYVGQPMTRCEASVVHTGADDAEVTIVLPDGGKRIIRFRAGQPDGSDSRGEFRFTREGDLNMIRIGLAERFEIPDSLAFGP